MRKPFSRSCSDWKAASPDARVTTYTAIGLGVVAALWAVFLYLSGTDSPLPRAEADSPYSEGLDERKAQKVIGGGAKRTEPDASLPRTGLGSEAGSRPAPMIEDVTARASNDASPSPDAETAQYPAESAESRAATSSSFQPPYGATQEHRTDQTSGVIPLWNELPASTQLAVLLVGDNREPLRSLGQEIADHFGGSAGLFRDRFVASGAFGRAMSGDVSALRDPGLVKQADSILLGEIRFAQIPDLHDPQLSEIAWRLRSQIIYLDRNSLVAEQIGEVVADGFS